MRRRFHDLLILVKTKNKYNKQILILLEVMAFFFKLWLQS